MEETSRFISHYHGVTTLTPISMAILVLGAMATFALPRRHLLLPLVLICSFVADSQRLVVGGLDLTFMRMMTMLAWARLAARGEIRRFGWSPIDTIFTAWITWRVVAAGLRSLSVGPLVNQLGHGVDALGIYFLARLVIRSWADLDAVIKTFAIVALPVAANMFYEVKGGWNFASVFSGLTGRVVDREGDIRAFAGYAHPILAGTFWAGMLPMLVARWWNPRASRPFVLASVGAALVCVWASSSSTPLLGVLIGMVAAGAWALRRHMYAVRWAILGVVIFVELATEQPIWHMFQRVSALGLSSSTGYHRFRLFDAFVRHFTDWAPIGLDSTAYWGRQLDDVTNTFIVQAMRGGLVGLVLVLALLVLLFQRNGWLLKAHRGRRPEEIYLWAFGSALFVHTAMMNAVGYLSQMQIPWYVCFALIAAAPLPSRARAGGPSAARAPSKAAEPAAPERPPGTPIASLLRRGSR